MVSRYHVEAWRRCPAARLVAVADPATAAAAARVDGAARVYDSISEMLAAGGLDAVDIAAPVGIHKSLVLEAAHAGLPVLCQKPLAASAADASAMVGNLPLGARVMLHENWRWRQPYRHLKAWLETHGPPKDFRFATMSAGLMPTADGRRPALERQPFLADLERLLVFEILIHHLDVCQYLFGAVEIIAAETRRRCPAVKGEDFARIRLRCGEVEGLLTGDLCCEGAPPLPEDRLSLDGGRSWRLQGWRLERPGIAPLTWDREEGYQASYDACIAHFAQALERGTAFETPAAHGVRLLEQVERIYELSRLQGSL